MEPVLFRAHSPRVAEYLEIIARNFIAPKFVIHVGGCVPQPLNRRAVTRSSCVGSRNFLNAGKLVVVAPARRRDCSPVAGFYGETDAD